ncbi:hypothetical protein [Saccharibacillus brassicae]|uniref:Uncharacterized protein n=1 Tax=Saccharibacillus brassicae TaxID=2583377 RepID=A0A4Y6V474_SACBS|nr:hypothetical protein [Saccharibacillus brassicae]QDH23480.1 hypothetical protein FFV09_23010 [Saccharibacillus brassicae]
MNDKAYYVDTVYGDKGEIVFGEKRSDAIYHSEAYNEDGRSWTDIRAVRQPKYDQFAIEGSGVPKSVLLQGGWWFECSGINEDGRRCCKRLTAEDDPVIENEGVYCRGGCYGRHMDKQAVK